MDALTIAAAGGLRSRMQSLDLLANNLANTGTSGYKRDQEFYGLFRSDESSPADGQPSVTLPLIQRQWTDFSQGNLQVTGNPFDIALNGPGFFAVNGPDGPLYTRNGNLSISASGELQVAGSYTLQDKTGQSIHVVSGKPVQISKDGAVEQDGQTIGQLKLVAFPSTQALQKVGSTCFQNTDPGNQPIAANGVEVQQGRFEESNVPVAEAAMRLVGVMRQFEMLQKAVGISSDMDTKSIQEVARIA